MQSYPVICAATPEMYQSTGAQGAFLQILEATGNVLLKDHLGRITRASKGWIGRIKPFKNLYVASDVANDVVIVNVGDEEEFAYLAWINGLLAQCKGQFQNESHPIGWTDLWPFVGGMWQDTSGGHGTGTIKAFQTKDGNGLNVQLYNTDEQHFELKNPNEAAGRIAIGRGLTRVVIKNKPAPAPPWTTGTITVVDQWDCAIGVYDDFGRMFVNPMTPTILNKVLRIDLAAVTQLTFKTNGLFDGKIDGAEIQSPIPSSIPLTLTPAP